MLGSEAAVTLSNRVKRVNVQTQFMVDDNTWPPDQPKIFTPLLLIHYQGHRTPEQVTTMAKLMYTGDIGEVAPVTTAPKCHSKPHGHENLQNIMDTSTATKEIKDILAPLENNTEPSFILIEGAPGTGKSVLLKEIAYRWGKKQLLQRFELVLLACLRDPTLQQTESIDDLVHLFYKGDKNAKVIVSACGEYLSRNDGERLVLLLDGYDEYPGNLQKSSLIADILKRKVLPLCGLVVSSRPHASEYLRHQATIRVDILGFTETEREHYIKQALPDQPHKVKELMLYLQRQPSVDSICFIPFNMVILLYLYKLGIPLPKNSTDIYHHFICSTICRHLYKFNNPLTHNVTDLTKLPEPCNKILKQLSKLSLEALNNNKLIFTLNDIMEACPDIVAIPGAINGFGLLQAVQHFGLYAKTVTLNFIHFTIQEFLAAHYISQLPPNEELIVIQENFWSKIHLNMFSMYISLTKGQRPSFKTFLSGGNQAIAISPEFLEDQLKCLRLYRCFREADDHTMCSTIQQAEIFKSKVIDLNTTTLAPSDLECISLFLTSSFSKELEWKWLVLFRCHILDKGLKILHSGLCHSGDVTINGLWLKYNDLTTRSSSLISDITVKCKVKVLMITCNDGIGEDQQLYSMLTNPYNVLEILYLDNVKLTSKAAIYLFTALKDNIKLKRLYINNNNITEEACDTITTALKWNSSLVTLWIYNNPLSNQAIVNIVQCLQVNNTLQLLELPICSHEVQEIIRSIQESINKKRESQGCQVNLDIRFKTI